MALRDKLALWARKLDSSDFFHKYFLHNLLFGQFFFRSILFKSGIDDGKKIIDHRR